MAGRVLDNAKKYKEDEFYTQLSDIEKELKNYKNQFNGKIVFCNCDDPEYSNFYYFFVSNFDEFGLRKLITTHFEIDKASYMLEYEGGADVQGDKDAVVKSAIKHGKKSKLKQNFQQGTQGELFEIEPVRSFSGDFRSPECIELLKESDIVVTNPPFSLFREFVSTLEEHTKKYLIIGNKNALTYKEIFKLISMNKLRTGYRDINQDMWFELPNNADKWEKTIGGKKLKHIMGCWFTNLNVKKHNENLDLYKQYTAKEYPKYDNYNAINVDKVTDIPYDYDGIMGVPITFIDKYNPKQFEIIGMASSAGYDKDIVGIEKNDKIKDARPLIKGKNTYARIFIKRKEVRHEN
jgi:hypothetical protein